MFSNIIVDALDSGISTLTKTSNLFCERGSGDSCVVVKTTINEDDPYIPVKSVNIQIVIDRFGVFTGHDLLKKIKAILIAMSGDYTYTNENSEVEKYTIKSVVYNNFTPFRQNRDENQSFSANYTFKYI